MSWQIIKKTSGLFDSATKYKSVFLATIKGGASFVSGDILPARGRRGVQGGKRPRRTGWWAGGRRRRKKKKVSSRAAHSGGKKIHGLR